jgi:hypothetical protein
LREAGRIADYFIGKIAQEPEKPDAAATVDDDDVIFLDNEPSSSSK